MWDTRRWVHQGESYSFSFKCFYPTTYITFGKIPPNKPIYCNEMLAQRKHHVSWHNQTLSLQPAPSKETSSTYSPFSNFHSPRSALNIPLSFSFFSLHLHLPKYYVYCSYYCITITITILLLPY